MKNLKKVIVIILIIIIIGGIYYYKSKPMALTETQIKTATDTYSGYINSINSNNKEEFKIYSGNDLDFNETKEFIDKLDNGNKIDKFNFKKAYKKQGNINYIFDSKFSNNKEMDIVVTIKNNKIERLNIF